jgi:nucleoid-associated protein YgaU
MTRPTRIEVNCSTGAVAEIELTDAEIAQREADAEAFAAQKVLDDAAEAVKATEKAAVLKRLGISAEEAKLLLA